MGDLAKAKEYTQNAVNLGKQEVSFSLLIRIFLTETDYDSAITICNQAVESCPDSVNMLSESALLYLKVGQNQQAFERFSSALALDPQYVKALLGIGCITQLHSEHDVALAKYKTAIQSEPDSVALWNNIGICFFSKEKFVAAISCLKRALWLSPLNWKVLFNLGLVHLSTYQPASAFSFLCAAVNIRPKVPRLFSVLGCALMELDDPENASRALRQAIILTPDDADLIANAALCSLRADNSDQALDFANMFASLPHSDSNAQYLMASIKELMKIEKTQIQEIRDGNVEGSAMKEENPDENNVNDGHMN